jgi:hypothetical protein
VQSRFLCILILASALCCLPDAARAASANATDTSNLVFIGGIPILRIRTATGGKTPQQRAQEVQLRLNHTLSVGPVMPQDITVGQVQGDWAVLFKGKRFLTADADTARQDKTPPEALANEWAVRIRQILPDLTRPTGVKH